MEEKKEQYCWDLSKIYQNIGQLDNDIEKVNKYLNAFDKFKGHMNDKEMVLEYFKLKSNLTADLDKIQSYISLGQDLDFNNMELKEREDVFDNFLNELNVKLTPISTELSKQSVEFLDSLINDARFHNYKMRIDSIKTSRKHVLSDKEEGIFALMGTFADGFEDVYTNIMNNDMSFKPIIVDGKEVKLTSANLAMYLKHKDRDVRKQAFLNNYEAVSKRINSAINSYIYKLKMSCCDLKIRNYESMLDGVLESEKIPKEVYYKLISKVEQNASFVKNFYELKKRAFKFDKFYNYDASLPLSVKADKKLTIEEQFDILKKALSPLGERYVAEIDKAIKDRWFDLYQSDTKLDSTFATMCYELKQPYVFMHQRFDYDSLQDLAHEFGHAVNFDFIMQKQTRENSGTAIYTAEIASTTNEILFLNYLYKNTNNIDEKIYFLEKYIETFIGTVITQTQFSQFEDYAHKLVENGEPITVDILCNKWAEIANKYNGGVFDEIEELKPYKKGQNFIRIHHFVYYNYYVFNYATSYTSAFNIANKILNGDTRTRDKYLEFLSKGSIEYPNDQVLEMGIDLSSDEPYELIFKDMNEKMKELDALVELREMRSTISKKLVTKLEITKKRSSMIIEEGLEK